MSGVHPTHKTRISDASSFDEICTICGATDVLNGGLGALAEPCPGPRKKVNPVPNEADRAAAYDAGVRAATRYKNGERGTDPVLGPAMTILFEECAIEIARVRLGVDMPWGEGESDDVMRRTIIALLPDDKKRALAILDKARAMVERFKR